MSQTPLPASTELDQALSLRPRDGTDAPESAGAVAYDAELGAGWRIGGGVNGGLLLSLVGTAMSRGLPHHRDPFSVSGYYLSAGVPGTATVETEVLRTGRSTATVAARLTQPGEEGPVERMRALATYGDLASLPDDVRTTATPPTLPPPEQCVGTDLAPKDFLAQADFLNRLDLRLDPGCVGWAVGEPSGRGRISGWLRMADGREPDPVMLLLAADALPPVPFDLGMIGWTPTLELTVHVRAKPSPGWLLVTHSTRNVAGGMLEEDAEVWDSAGRLVAQSRQLALVPRLP